MGVTIEHVDFVAYTGSGAVQRVSLPSNFTATPKLFRVVMSGAASDSTIDVDSQLSEGWYDGVTSWVIACRVDHGAVSSSDTESYATTDSDRVGAIIDQSSQALDDYCQFDAWGTDGGVGYVDLEWNGGASSSSVAYRCRLTAYTGTDFSAEIGVESVDAGSQSVGTEYTIPLSSGSTIHPAAVRCHGALGLTIGTGDNYNANLVTFSGWGVSDQAATPAFQQFAFGTASENAATTPDQGATMFNSEQSGGTARCLARGDTAGVSTSNMEWELTDTAEGEWSYTPRNAVTTTDIAWVAMDFGGVIPVGVAYYQQKGSNDVSGYDGNFSVDVSAVDGSGTFQPQAVDWVASDFAATGYQNGNLTGSVNPYCALSANHHDDDADAAITTGSTINFAHRNNNANRFAWSYHSKVKFIEVLKHNDGSVRWNATASLAAAGVDLVVGTVPASTTKVCSFIAFGVGATTSPITATLAGTSSVSSAALVGLGSVAATLAGSASIGGAAIVGFGAMTAALAGSASIGAAVTGPAAITATLAGSASLTATPVGVGVLGATLPGTSSVAAAIDGPGALSATLAGSATISSAGLGVIPSPITATLAGSASISSAGIVGVGVLGSTLAGSASIAAAPSAIGALTSTLAGSATLSAPVVGFGAMSSTLAGSATVSSANLIDGAAVGILPISATLAGGSSLSAAIVGFGEVTATLAGSASLSGGIVGIGALSAALAGGSSLSAAISATGALSATLAGAASLSGGIVGVGVLSAALPGSATISSANLSDSAATGIQPISATLAGSSSVAAALSGPAALSATLAGSASLSAPLVGLGAMSATLPGSASISGAALAGGPAPLSATLAGTSSVSVALSGVGVLSSTLAGSASLAAAISGPAAISATLAGTSTLAAAMSGQDTLALLVERGFLYLVVRRDRSLDVQMLREANLWTPQRRERNLYAD